MHTEFAILSSVLKKEKKTQKTKKQSFKARIYSEV